MPNIYHEAIAQAFEDELKKIAIARPPTKANLAKPLGLMAAGAVGYESLRRAEHDRRNGRMMRIQQGY